jgi:hypothetical protein
MIRSTYQSFLNVMTIILALKNTERIAVGLIKSRNAKAFPVTRRGGP